MKEVKMDKKEDEITEQRFDRNLRIVAGVISVLGAAATTVMTIMETEKSVRARKLKQVKGKTLKGKTLLLKTGKKLPPKQKMVRRTMSELQRKRIAKRNFDQLERKIRATLVKAKALVALAKEEAKKLDEKA